MPRAVCAILALLIAGCSNSPPEGMMGTADDPMVLVQGGDPEMEQARNTARARLPEFWAIYDNPAGEEEDLALKVEISDAGGTEFFWASPIEKRDGKIYGIINNDPNIVESVEFGDEVEIPEDKIADWMYMKAGKMHGNFTMRPLLKQMPAAEAEQYRAMLAEP
jgi:uncharacterized protein YegJ (DUF2314 family)